MNEELLNIYFEQEGAKGDLSPDQWGTVLNAVRTTNQKRGSWSPFTWIAARKAVADGRDDLTSSRDSQLQADQRPRSSWQRLIPASRLGWVAYGLVLFAMLGAVGYAISPTLGERLFSQVMGRWDQDYTVELSKEINIKETIEGVTVTVDRAYFDKNRIGIEYTVTGLPQSHSVVPREFEIYAVLEDANAPDVRFRSAGGSGVRSDSQIEGMEVPPDTMTEVVAFDVTGAQADASGMRLSLVVSVDESARDGDVLLQVRTIGPFVFNFEVPFVPSMDIRVIHVGSTIEVSGVPVRLEEVTITPAEVAALIVVDRTPEQRQAGLKPRSVVLSGPWDWPAYSPLPDAYVVTTLGDMPDTFLARFQLIWEAEPGEWTLTVENLRDAGDAEVLNGPWIFHFQVP